MKRILEKYFVHSPVHYIVAVGLAIVFGVLRFFTLGEYASTRLGWFDILSMSGAATVLVGGLLLVTYLGSFDLYAYTFSPGRIRRKSKYKNFGDYAEQKKEERSKGNYYFMPYFVVGIVVVLISLIFC